MHRFALRFPRAAAIFFDFTAAFPSLDHGYMFAALEAFGVPVGIRTFIRKLYVNNLQVVKLGSSRRHSSIHTVRSSSDFIASTMPSFRSGSVDAATSTTSACTDAHHAATR